ncbi:MAG: hypothetical protein KAJ98_13695 [Spirochaetaceae bacterium]|nr:hypothetical protein [Spirochaetaceae bacterium]
MRTTLTIDDNLLLSLKRKAAERNIPFKTLVNQVLHRGLEVMDTPFTPGQKYYTQARSLKLKQGFDHDTLGQIADEMEDEAGFKHSL